MHFQTYSSTIDNILRRKSKGQLEENITTPATLNKSFTLKLIYIGNYKIDVKFEGNNLKQDKVSFSHGNVVNILIF